MSETQPSSSENTGDPIVDELPFGADILDDSAGLHTEMMEPKSESEPSPKEDKPTKPNKTRTYDYGGWCVIPGSDHYVRDSVPND